MVPDTHLLVHRSSAHADHMRSRVLRVHVCQCIFAIDHLSIDSFPADHRSRVSSINCFLLWFSFLHSCYPFFARNLRHTTLVKFRFFKQNTPFKLSLTNHILPQPYQYTNTVAVWRCGSISKNHKDCGRSN